MTEPTNEELRAAEAALERRVLDKSIDAITDPRLKGLAEQYRDGQLTAAEFVERTSSSPAATQGVDRVTAKLKAMPEEAREALVAKVDATIREVADRRRQAAQRKQAEADRPYDQDASNEDRSSFMAQRKRDPRRGR